MTPSQLLAINQEDLTKETAQQNLPGTHLAVSELGPEDAVHDRAIARRRDGAELHADVPELGDAVGAGKLVGRAVGPPHCR